MTNFGHASIDELQSLEVETRLKWHIQKDLKSLLTEKVGSTWLLDGPGRQLEVD